MFRTTAHIPTENGAKYAQQLCKHWGHRLEVEWVEGQGAVRFPMGTAMMSPRPDILLVTVEAENKEALEHLKGVLTSHLDRFAFREAPLRYDWRDT